MNTIDKIVNQLFEEDSGIEAYKKVDLLKEKINTENREIILNSLMEYVKIGQVKHIREFILIDLVELVKNNEKKYADFFKNYIEIDYSNKSYWSIKGYVKAAGEDSYEFLSRIVLDSRSSFKNKIVIIRELAKHSNNTFDNEIPKNPKLWKEKYINYKEFEDWIFGGYEIGNGYKEPCRHESLDNPKDENEIVLSKIDKKLKILRNKKQDLSNPSNYLAIASEEDIKKITKKFRIPENYLTFLKRYSPINAELTNNDFGIVSIYGAHNLIKNQEGYSYNPITKHNIKEWDRKFLVIADSAVNPFCIDMTLENSPIYFAYHGTGTWDFNIVYDNLIDFLKSFIY